jgi:hypothetical protein
MAATIITMEDLKVFKSELLNELIELISQQTPKEIKVEQPEVKWLKSHQVQRMLGISPGTLQNLRINSTIPYTKVGGVIFYSLDDINNIMQKNKRNSPTNGKLF